ncbi:hypothetical protein [Paraherbaspirillum soli]|uniref:Uncharacterized protein n=1 Tax=Paraherbaspirillum soli TaxID=631222 RepID=A0ABW0MDK6_9BURK
MDSNENGHSCTPCGSEQDMDQAPAALTHFRAKYHKQTYRF